VAVNGDFELNLALGEKAYEEGLTRTDNPHLANAIAWDRGWVGMARQQEASTDARTRILSFQTWISIQGKR
jgi:hypothetical protein